MRRSIERFMCVFIFLKVKFCGSSTAVMFNTNFFLSVVMQRII